MASIAKMLQVCRSVHFVNYSKVLLSLRSKSCLFCQLSRNITCSAAQRLAVQYDNYKPDSEVKKTIEDFDAELNKEKFNDKNPKKDQKKSGKRKLLAIALGLSTFGLLEYLYFKHWDTLFPEKKSRLIKSVGRPSIGGPWELVNTDGKTEGSEQLKGNWLLMYFGFTHCPDVCPDELEKMAKVVEKIDSVAGNQVKLIPVFISVDPARDTPEAVKEYCAEFSPKMKGYTGTSEQIAEVAKVFRVYYKAGARVPTAPDDYIVDHSVIVYLMDPDGNFVDFYGQNKAESEVIDLVTTRAAEYEAKKKKSWFSR